jgi:glycosyltransferase involved in cell wall biosynthesis
MRISVVIATYNRGAMLGECLRHLADQPFETDDEVVVVNNGSTDNTSRVIEASRQRFSVRLRHLTESRPGKSHAIAAAIAATSGDVLAFTDDDVTVDASWIAIIRRIMRDSNAALVGGPVFPRWEASPPRWLHLDTREFNRLAAPLGLLNYGPAALELGPRTVLGANMAVRRASINKVGGFAGHLGKLRGTLLSGEDHELCQRVQAAGLKAMYFPELRVAHWVPIERMRASYSMSWFFWSGITHATLDAAEPDSHQPLRGVPPYFLKRALRSSIRGIGAAVRGQPAQLMDNATDVAFVAGYAARRWGVKGERP